MLLIACRDIESNPGPASGRGFGSSILIFMVFMPISTSWLGLDLIMMFWFVLSLKLVSDRRDLSELCFPAFGCSKQRLRNSTLGARGTALYVREGFRSFRQSKLKCSCHESCVFCICYTINIFFMFMPFTVTQDTMVHFATVSLTLWLSCNQLMIRQYLSLLVMPMLITLIGWS